MILARERLIWCMANDKQVESKEPGTKWKTKKKTNVSKSKCN